MNKRIMQMFEDIRAAVDAYAETARTALSDFAENVETVKADRSLSEEGRSVKISHLKGKTREKITQRRDSLRRVLSEKIPMLTDEIVGNLKRLPSEDFLKVVRLYRENGIQPSELEVRSLLDLSGANILGYRCINSLLEATGSTFRLRYPDIEQYSNDLAVLRRFLDTDIIPAPRDLHISAVQVWGGVKKDGDRYGGSWDSISLITSESLFEGFQTTLPIMAENWSENLLPAPDQIELYETAEEFLSAVDSTKSAEIEEDPAAIAAQQAQTVSEEQRKFRDVMEQYR